MGNDDLKTLWKEVKTPEKDANQLSNMLKAKNHPVLKSIKRQAVFEFLAFAIFLFCYYIMFDGSQKPLLINLILIFAVAFNMLNHLKGYRLQQQFRASENIKADLKSFAAKLKNYQIEVIICKVILVIGLMLFFTNGIEFTEKKWFAMAAITILFILQLALINNIWQKRITRIKLTIQDFENT